MAAVIETGITPCASTGAPAITAQPKDLSISEGQRAQFTVAASGTQPLYYQWQRDQKNLDGEITPTFFIPLVTMDDTGTRFRCVVSNALGFVLSREASLAVFSETNPPVIASLNPAEGMVVRNLAQVEVLFSEPVHGVGASDFLVNGQPATNVTGSAAGPYVFQFPAPAPGQVQFQWAANQQIQDYATRPNAFTGISWRITLNPGNVTPDVVINEILAANLNTNGLKDEEGDLEGWIELHNRGPLAAPLAGWSLSDDPEVPGKWLLPSITIPPGGYWVVFASGKDRRSANAAVKNHTNFKLNATGEYLGLFNGESPRIAVSQFAPGFPEQRTSYSYGLDPAGQWRYYSTPTPGVSNGVSLVAGLAQPVHFSVQRGFFNRPFNLYLHAGSPAAQIRYTLDGSEPTFQTGIDYTNAIIIQQTRVIRAAAFLTNNLPSTVATHTYLYNLPAAQRSLPVLSIVTDQSNLTGPAGIMGISGGTYVNGVWQSAKAGDYYNPIKTGPAWERPVSLELIRPEDNGGFQVRSGIRVHASTWFRPRLTAASKFSFNLYFRGEYGAGKLHFPWFTNCVMEEFDEIVLRAGSNDPTNPFIKDELARRLAADTGQAASHGGFVNLFINGKYKGYYNPAERIEKQFCQAWQGGGANWDVMEQFGEVLDGDATQWNNLKNFIFNRPSTVLTNYQEVSRRLDLTNFVDYLLVNIYGATGDWPDNNWRTARERATNGVWRYYIWDAEWAFGTYGRAVTLNTLTGELGGSSDIALIYRALKVNPEFRLLFADRIHRHFFNNGALADTNILTRYLEMKSLLAGVIPNMETYIPNTWIPQRRKIIMGHFQANGLLASSNAPVFSQHGGHVPLNYPLSMVSSNGGDIYFTTNGLDPRVPYSGAVLASARLLVENSTWSLPHSLLLKARTRQGANWSALTEAAFQVDYGAPIRFAEIMYRPDGGSAYEFLELMNIGGAPLDLGGMKLEGVSFTFPPYLTLKPGEIMVLASDENPAAFAARYPQVKVAGYFKGQLNNGGERLALLDRRGQTITSVHYRGGDGWPPEADGAGYSLQIIDPKGDPNAPASWRASPEPGGDPGTFTSLPATATVQLNEILPIQDSGNVDGQTVSGWIELHNASGQAMDLSGWTLDSPEATNRYAISNATLLAAGQYLLLAPAHSSGLSANDFRLSNRGGTVVLYDAHAHPVDSLRYGRLAPGYSLGRQESEAAAWALCEPTPSAPNRVATITSAANLFINEWLLNAEPGRQPWIELFNQDTALPAALQGLWLASSNAAIPIQSMAFIAPGGFARFWLTDKQEPDCLDLKCSTTSGFLSVGDSAGHGLNRVVYGAQWPGLSQGRWPDGSSNILAFTNSPSPEFSNYINQFKGPLFNEIMACSTNDWPDWIELYNPSASTLDLSGMSLSGDEDHAGQWLFPDGARMGPKTYLLVLGDPLRPMASQGDMPLNLGAALPDQGGGLYLFNRLRQRVDTLEFGHQVPGLSLGRLNGVWRLLANATPGQTNAQAAPLGNINNLRFNEWTSASANGGDWIEIFNLDANPVDLSGAFISDDPSTSGQVKFQVRPLSFIGGHGFALWSADGQRSRGPAHLNFQLDKDGETLRLFSAATNLVEAVDILSMLPEATAGRWPDGAASIVNLGASPTPGWPNQLDSDGDGLPDDWERQFGLDPDDPLDAVPDSDGDGLSNLEEFRVGSSPRDPASALRFEIIQSQGNVAVVSFTALAGRSYSLLHNGAIGNGYWAKWADVEVQSVTRRMELNLGMPPLGGQHFFRLVTPAIP